MKEINMQKHPFFTLIFITMLMLTAIPAAAQNDDSGAFLANTITVMGNGSAYGAPDIAYLSLGVDKTDPNVSVAFTQANQAISAVIEAIVAAGVPREDIRTTAINVYQPYYGASPFAPPMMGAPEPTETPSEPSYQVSTQLFVTVHDVSVVASVIDAAVAGGANNIYGFNLGLSDTKALESQARVEAMEAPAAARSSLPTSSARSWARS
jgi:uncharacterized protein YggE